MYGGVDGIYEAVPIHFQCHYVKQHFIPLKKTILVTASKDARAKRKPQTERSAGPPVSRGCRPRYVPSTDIPRPAQGATPQKPTILSRRCRAPHRSATVRHGVWRAGFCVRVVAKRRAEMKKGAVPGQGLRLRTTLPDGSKQTVAV